MAFKLANLETCCFRHHFDKLIIFSAIQYGLTLILPYTITVMMVKLWSTQPLFGLKPTCSSLSFVSIAFSILFNKTRRNTLLGTESSVMPLQLLQSLRHPFFSNLSIMHLARS